MAPSVPNTRIVLSDESARRLPRIGIGACEQQARQPGHGGLARHQRRVAELPGSQHAHAFGGGVIPNGDEGVGASFQDAPGQD